jgi:polar amino acid transport system permease protein
VAVVSIFFGTLIGLFLAVLRRFNNRLLNTIIILYVNFYRAMPIIVFLLFIYYGLPALNILLDAYTSCILVLSFASGAVTSEIFRSGIESIHHSQIEASRALGLTSTQTMRYIILPQAFRIVVPPMANSWIGTLKDTAVCSVVALVELLKAAQVSMAGKANPTPLIAGTAIYIAIILPLTRFTRFLEIKMQQRKGMSG